MRLCPLNYELIAIILIIKTAILIIVITAILLIVIAAIILIVIIAMWDIRRARSATSDDIRCAPVEAERVLNNYGIS